MKQKLTDKLLKSLRPTYGAFQIMDDTVRGFAVRVAGTEKEPLITFLLIARYPGIKSSARRSIGHYPEISLAQARETARSWRELIAVGRDPQAEADRQRHADRSRQENSFAVVAERFFKRGLTGKRTAGKIERTIRAEFVKPWGEKTIQEITRADVIAAIDAVVDRGAPQHARNVFGCIRQMFNWCIGRAILESSPCDRVRVRDLVGRKIPRSRILSDVEIRAYWAAAETMGYPYGDLCKLWILTGLRRWEAAGARWSEFDLARRRWLVPPERMKGREGESAGHLVPLTDDVIAVLESLPRFKRGDALFSTSFGVSPIGSFSRDKRRLDELMTAELGGELQPFVIHDIRRSVRTHLSALPVPEGDLVRELIIAHGRQGIGRVYDLFAYEEQKRAGLQFWAQRLRAILDDRPGENVVNLADRR